MRDRLTATRWCPDGERDRRRSAASIARRTIAVGLLAAVFAPTLAAVTAHRSSRALEGACG